MQQSQLRALIPNGPFQTHPVQLEAAYRRGLPQFQISGFVARRNRELSERIKCSIQAAGFAWPLGAVQLHLSPNDLPKTGALMDLSIAACLLRCIGENIPPDALLFRDDVLFLGELSLSGDVLTVPELPSLAREAGRSGFRYLAIPEMDRALARFADVERLVLLSHLTDILQPLEALPCESPDGAESLRPMRPPLPKSPEKISMDRARALAACAAGWHPILLLGPPGSGKSTLARMLPSLLPPPDADEALELISMFPGQAKKETALPQETERDAVSRPFRSPHHSCTLRGMIGGGSPIQTGEVSRAHHGLLLLDELAEFSRPVLQSLREPLLDSCVYLSRGAYTIRLPARFLLAATSNPCPCGFFGSEESNCLCKDASIRSYTNRLLGPLRDRIEIELFVSSGDSHRYSLSPAEIQDYIDRATESQLRRYESEGYRFNGEIPLEDIDEYAPLRGEAQLEWTRLIESRRFSQRSKLALRRLARTLADLDAATEIRAIDLLEAASLRLLDSFYLSHGFR